jgi:hypothetical protein
MGCVVALSDPTVFDREPGAAGPVDHLAST